MLLPRSHPWRWHCWLGWWRGNIHPPNPTSTNTLHRHRRARHVQTHANEDYSTLQCTYMHANTVPVSVTCCKRREHVQCVAHRTNPGTWTGRTWSITLYIFFFSKFPVKKQTLFLPGWLKLFPWLMFYSIFSLPFFLYRLFSLQLIFDKRLVTLG